MMFPATRMTNMSPTPRSKTISGGTRESEHPMMMAKGNWSGRSLCVRWMSADFPATNRLFPSTSFWSAFGGVGMVYSVLWGVVGLYYPR